MTSPVVEADGSTLESWLGEHGEGLVALRRNLHAHPELSGEEFATTEIVFERLALAGLAPRRLQSGTGLVCDLDPDGNEGGPGGELGARLALRADLDALGMDDEKDVPYRSQVPGVAHACGHDVHTAIMLGVALYFAHHRDELPGPLRFIFQPAEERVPGGALDVLRDDGLTGVDAIVGVHCDPKLTVGSVGLRAGAISSAADMARIVLHGPGGHTARPEQTVDMLTVAARLITELPARVSELLGGPNLAKVVFGAVRAGDAANVIPARCELRASVRTPEIEVWERLPHVVDQALRGMLVGTGAEFELDYTHGVPPVVNDAGFTEIAHRAAERALGRDAVTPAVQSWGGDDFAWFLRERPGSYIRLGVHDPARSEQLDLHAGRFDVDERAIAVGVRLMVETVHEYHASTRA